MTKTLIKIKNTTLRTELFVNLMLLVVLSVLILGSLSHFVAAAVLLLLATVIAYLLVKKNVDPIYELLTVVKKFGKGDFSQRAEVKSMNEVGQLACEFNNMADKLEELDSAKSEFISLASHQLKNPLSVIKMNSELLSMDKDLTDEQKEFVEDIEKATNSLDRLIKTLLNVSKIEMEVFDLKLESINLAKAIEEELEDFMPSIDAKNIKLNKDIENKPLIAKSDESIVRITLENVISNAVKYTPKNKEVFISASRENGNILIKVSDTGYGIPQKEQSRIFTKMYRASNVRDTEAKGSGLGLYMAKKQLERAGGKIWFESQEGEGTTFFISVPVE